MLLVRNSVGDYILLIHFPILAWNEAQALAELKTDQSIIQKNLVEKDIPSLEVSVALNGKII